MLPTCSKALEKLVFDAIFEFQIENNLLSSTQSGFKSNNPCVNQLISVTRSIFSAFDINPSLEVRGVFLDLSKAFDRVWHKCLLYKLKNSGINGNLLINRKWMSFNWKFVKAGVTQCSVLGS